MMTVSSEGVTLISFTRLCTTIDGFTVRVPVWS